MSNLVWKTFAAQELSHSVAHYLTTIHDLHKERGYARVSDVARALDLTKGAVSIQLKHIKEKGFITEDDNRFLRLTDSGKAIARDVIENRALLIRFLTEVLGVAARQAEEDACKVEHLLSHETGNQILGLLGFLDSGAPEARAFAARFREFRERWPAAASARLGGPPAGDEPPAV